MKAAAEARHLVYGEAGHPGWGTSFAEIEADAKEVGHEFIRLLMEQTAGEQAVEVPESALLSDSGEQAQWTGQEQDRTLITESGAVSWREPKAYLPKSRKDFSPQTKALGLEVDEDLSPAVTRKSVHWRQSCRHSSQPARAWPRRRCRTRSWNRRSSRSTTA